MSSDTDSLGSKITGGRIAIACILLFLAYISWLAYSAPEPQTSTSKLAEVPVAVEVTRYVRRTVNVRELPNLKAKLKGQRLRGAKISGILETDTDGTREWLKLSDNAGYVSANLLSEDAPPALDNMLEAEYYFTVDAKVMQKPDASSTVLGEGGQGSLFAVGRAGEWIEILWKSGKVGYVHRDSLLFAAEGDNAASAGAKAEAAGTEAAGAGDRICSGSLDGRWMYCGENAAVCATSLDGRHVACGGLATNCVSSLSGNDVACGGLATICTSSLDGNDVACGGLATICTSSLNGNDVACGGNASICTTSLNGNDAACGGSATGCTTSLSGRRACGNGRYSAD